MTSRVETWLGLVTIAVLPALVLSQFGLGALSGGCKVREYIGCYMDVNSDRDLPVLKGLNKQDDECATLCEGFKYFSLQNTRECFCGNSFGKHGPRSDCSCSAAFIGAGRNCVYELRDPIPNPDHPSYCGAEWCCGAEVSQVKCERYSNKYGCHWVKIRSTFFETQAPLVGIFICLCLFGTCGCSMAESCTQWWEKQMFDKAAKLQTPAAKILFIKEVVLQIVFLLLAFVSNLVVRTESSPQSVESAEAFHQICGDSLFALEVPCLGQLIEVTTQLLLMNGLRPPMFVSVANDAMSWLWPPYAIFVLVAAKKPWYGHSHGIHVAWCCLIFLWIAQCVACCAELYLEGCGDQQSTDQQPQQQPLLTAPQTVPQLPQPVDRRGTRWPPFDLSRIPAPPSFWTNQDLSKNFDVRCEVSAKTRAKVEILVNSTWSTTRTRDRKGKMVSKLRVLKVQRIEDALMYVNYQAAKMKMKARHDQCRKIKDISPGGRVKTAGFSGSSRFGDDHLSPELNECYLFHGTSPGGAAGISEDGFRLSLAGSHRGSMFGDGAYLAECSSKADEYASDDVGSIYQDVYALIVCRALCGEMLYSEEPGDFQQTVLESSGKYDSLLGDREKAVGTYREFVFFNKWQIYPEFVVLYERCYD